MEDQKIIALYFDRSEAAIGETKEKYGSYCSSIAYNILGSLEETEECVSDVYLRIWDTIPPERPNNFRAYLGRITANLALSRYRKNHAKKRSAFTEVLEEMEVTDFHDPCSDLEKKELARTISEFLRKLSPGKRQLFLLRYWYYYPVKTISKKTGLKEERVSVELYRIRTKLRRHLEQEGYIL